MAVTVTEAVRPRRFHSPCRSDASKGARAHRCSPSHAEAVEAYRLWRQTELERAETETIGYETELAEYWQTHDRPTFGRYLRDMRDPGRP